MPFNWADRVLVTCSSGKQCTQFLPFIASKCQCLRLAVNSDASFARMSEAYPNAEIIKADMTEPPDCRKLIDGVTTVYHVGPSMHPHETEIGYNMINAALGEAKKGVFRHFVYSSVLCTQLRKLANHDCKRYVEECLMESELNYTILKPSIFMDGMAVEKLISDPSPVHPAFYDPNVCFAWTSLYDLGEAAAKVVEEMEKHYLAVYDTVSSSPPMGHTEAVEIIGKTLGKKIEVRRLPFSEAFGTFEKRFGQDPHKYTKHSAARMLLHYEYYGLRGSPNVLEWLLGRKPESFEVFTERKMREAQK